MKFNAKLILMENAKKNLALYKLVRTDFYFIEKSQTTRLFWDFVVKVQTEYAAQNGLKTDHNIFMDYEMVIAAPPDVWKKYGWYDGGDEQREMIWQRPAYVDDVYLNAKIFGPYLQ